MPRVCFSNNEFMFAAESIPLTFTTDPHPMGGNDYVEIFCLLYQLAQTGGAAALTITVQVSNDGTTWLDTTLVLTPTTASQITPTSDGDFIRAAFIRMKYELEVTGGGGTDQAWAAFDIHANLLKSGS